MKENWIKEIASLAQRALLYEATLFPKPGLVDPISCGAHKDMDIGTFIDSSVALGPAFSDFVRIGVENAHYEYQTVQRMLRQRGIIAEKEMFRATNQVNTHKGIIYSMAFCLCAVGRILRLNGDCSGDENAFAAINGENLPTLVLGEVQHLSFGILQADMQKALHKENLTVGERLYLKHGLAGVRGEVEDGLPTARMAYHLLVDNGALSRQNLLSALLHIMAVNSDTNVISRGGFEALDELKIRSKAILQEGITDYALQGLDAWCIEKNISPGGSADLLSIAIFLYLFKEMGDKI